MEEVRIAYVIATLDRAGTETQLVNLATGLRRPPFQARIIALTRGGDLQSELLSAGIPVEILGKRRKLDMAVLSRLCGHLKRFRPHIVHTWLFTANGYGRAAALLARVPIIIASERSLDPWKRIFHNLIDDLLGICTAQVVANAEAVKAAVLKRHPSLRDKVRVIYNGIPPLPAVPDRAEMRERLGIPADASVLTSVGRLSPEKGLEDLLHAFQMVSARIEGAWLLVVGQGEQDRRLRELSQRLGVGGRIKFLGELPSTAEVLAACDLFVLASRYEGLPNSILEALQLELPVVATAVGGIPEVIEDGVTGVLVSPGDHRALADKILWLLDHLTEGRKLARLGKSVVEARFGLERMVREYANVYLELLPGKR